MSDLPDVRPIKGKNRGLMPSRKKKRADRRLHLRQDWYDQLSAEQQRKHRRPGSARYHS